MSITESGKGLSVLVCTDYRFVSHWMSFAAWYSVRKNLPDADIGVVCARYPINLQLYDWVYRAGVKFFCHSDVGRRNGLPYLNKLYGVYVALKEGLVSQPLVVLDSDMMAVRGFSADTVRGLNGCRFGTNRSLFCPPVGPVWYFKDQPLEIFQRVLDRVKQLYPAADGQQLKHLDLLALSHVLPVTEVEGLGNEAPEESTTTFTHYRERCGNFYRKDYEKGIVYPPFAESYRLGTVDMSVSEKRVYGLWAQMLVAFDALNKR
jgi:hypothetical protein